MSDRPRAMIANGFCPPCGHRLAAHDVINGCTVGDCWCPLTLAAESGGEPE